MSFFAKLFGIKEITVDEFIDETGTNPVQGKAIHKALLSKQDKSEASSQPVVDNAVRKDGESAVSGAAVYAAIASVLQSLTSSIEDMNSQFGKIINTVRETLTNRMNVLESAFERLTFKTINHESILGVGNIDIKCETKEVKVPSQVVTLEDTGNAVYLPKADVLTQVMLDSIKPRQTIVVAFDYELKSAIQFPDFSHIVFNGGCLKGAYKVTGNHCTINEDVAYAIFNDAVPVGFNLSYIDLRWFGGIPDYNESTKIGTDNYIYFKRAIDLIGKYYNGLYIKLVGKYYIGTTLETEYDVNIVGSHFPSRYSTVSSSPSLIAVASNVTAFKMNGRNPGGKDWKIAYIFVKNVKVIGLSTSNSTFIEYKALGCPTRISSIEECEFVGLQYALFLNIAREGVYTVDTSLGNLSVSRCLAYACKQFIRGYSSTKLSDSWVGNTFNNISIRDCNIEQNGTYAIELGTKIAGSIYGAVFGNVVIDNNNLEGQETPIRVVAGYANVTVSNNYFEATSGEYVMDIHCTNSNSRAVLLNNYYAVHNNRVRLSNFKNRNVFDNAQVS